MDLGCFLGCSPFLSDKPKQDQILRLHDLVNSREIKVLCVFILGCFPWDPQQQKKSDEAYFQQPNLNVTWGSPQKYLPSKPSCRRLFQVFMKT